MDHKLSRTFSNWPRDCVWNIWNVRIWANAWSWGWTVVGLIPSEFVVFIRTCRMRSFRLFPLCFSTPLRTLVWPHGFCLGVTTPKNTLFLKQRHFLQLSFYMWQFDKFYWSRMTKLISKRHLLKFSEFLKCFICNYSLFSVFFTIVESGESKLTFTRPSVCNAPNLRCFLGVKVDFGLKTQN